jgi:hypothetical protein
MYETSFYNKLISYDVEVEEVEEKTKTIKIGSSIIRKLFRTVILLVERLAIK